MHRWIAISALALGTHDKLRRFSNVVPCRLLYPGMLPRLQAGSTFENLNPLGGSHETLRCFGGHNWSGDAICLSNRCAGAVSVCGLLGDKSLCISHNQLGTPKCRASTFISVDRAFKRSGLLLRFNHPLVWA